MKIKIDRKLNAQINIKKYLKFIYVFFIIGLESLGNMSAVLTILRENLVKKNNYVSEEDLIDAVAIGRLGPGATTANAVAFIGNKIGGFFGGVVATICYTIGPLIIILLIYGFFERILQYQFIASALKGGLVCLSIGLINSVFDMGKSVLNNKINIGIFIVTLVAVSFVR